MARFTVISKNKVVKTYDLNEPVITIGRLPESTIPIYNDGVSRCHVKITEDVDRSYLLTDLHSLNGTYVNGKRIKEVTLASGDKIVIGDCTIIYQEDDEQNVSEDFEEGTVAEDNYEELSDLMESAKSKSTVTNLPAVSMEDNENAQNMEKGGVAVENPLDSKAEASELKPNGINLALQTSEEESESSENAQENSGNNAVLIDVAKHIMYKLDRPAMTIGSDDADDIYASGIMVGKACVSIEVKDEGVYLTCNHLMSKLKINGKTVKSHLLQHKDRIEIGNSTFRYTEKE